MRPKRCRLSEMGCSLSHSLRASRPYMRLDHNLHVIAVVILVPPIRDLDPRRTNSGWSRELSDQLSLIVNPVGDQSRCSSSSRSEVTDVRCLILDASRSCFDVFSKKRVGILISHSVGENDELQIPHDFLVRTKFSITNW